MNEEIQINEIQSVLTLFQNIFQKIIKDYNSLLFAIKDNAGMEALKRAKEELQNQNIDISRFPNQDKLQFYITHYVKDIPAISRLQEFIKNKEQPQKSGYISFADIAKTEQSKTELVDAKAGLNAKQQLLLESIDGIQTILTGWALIQFLIDHPNRISIGSMKQIMQYGYHGNCGTPIMQNMYHLLNQIQQLQAENNSLKIENASLKQFNQSNKKLG